MKDESVIYDVMNEFKLDLDHKNALVLEELNNDIEKMASIPVSNLPEYKDNLDTTSPPSSFKTSLKQELMNNESLLEQKKALDKQLQDILNIDQSSQITPDAAALKDEMDQRDLQFKKSMAEFSTRLEDLHTPAGQTPTDTIPATLQFVKEQSKLTSAASPSSPIVADADIIPEADLNNALYEQSISVAAPMLTSSHDPIATVNRSRLSKIHTLPTDPRTSNLADLLDKNINFNEADVEDDKRSNAIVNVLRTLQDRVGKLEQEKMDAKEKIHSLEHELATTRKLLLQQQAMASIPRELNPSSPIYSQSPIRSDSSPQEKSRSLPLPDKTLDGTMKNIADARIKVDSLKERVNHVKNLAEESGHHDHIYTKATNLDAMSHHDVARNDAKKYLDRLEPVAFESILQKQSNELLKTFKTSSARDQHVSDSPRDQVPMHRSPSPFKDQIHKLDTDMIADRKDNRKNDLSETSVLKAKVLEKIKAAVGGSCSNEDRSWKKTDKRPKSASLSKSGVSHIRKKAPIEIPSVSTSSKEDRDRGGREMPFIIGKNTGKSFSVTANLQKVFSLLKSHNSEMCSICSKRHPPNTNHHAKTSTQSESKNSHSLQSNSVSSNSNKALQKTKRKHTKTKSATSQISIPTSTENPESLYQILGMLEEECNECKSQYNELVRQYETVAASMNAKSISESTGSATLKAIGEDLRHVIQSMDAKSDQIAIIRDILTASMTLTQKQRNHKSSQVIHDVPPKRYTMDTITSRSRSNGHLKKDPEFIRRRERSQSPGRAMASLSLLKSSLKVQNALE